MIKTFKFRLFINDNQERELSKTLETHRRLYNAALDGKKLCWESAGVNWSYYEQSAWFKIQRRSNSWYASLNFWSAQNTLRDLDKAYVAFFRKGGFPKFKSSSQFNSFKFDMGGHGGGCRIVGGKLKLQNIGTVRVRWHREIPHEARFKQCSIVRDNGKWFACFSVELPDPIPTANNKTVGIDVGLTSFATTSEGESLGDSRSLERNKNELRRRQRALARCKDGSSRRRKVKKRVTDLYAKVRNTRKDIHHKVARSLVNRFGTIVAERLNIQGMLKNRRLARRISDAGWYSFIQILTYKAESAGGVVILVDPKNTSQQCSKCGEIVFKSLDVRVHKCSCGCELDRDMNAAINILARAEPWIANVAVGLH